MAITKREKTYWLNLSIGGRRIRESLNTSNKREAQLLHDARVAELRGHAQGVPTVATDKTFADLYGRWAEDLAPRKSKGANSMDKFWRDYFGTRKLTEIRRSEIEQVISGIRKQKYRYGNGGGKVSPATRNRYLASIRRLLNLAADWEWIENAPRLPKIERESGARTTWATPAQAVTLIAYLQARCPETALAARLALATGLRQANVFGVLESEINLASRTLVVPAEKFKSRKNHIVPLNDEAVTVLGELKPGRDGRLFSRTTPCRTVFVEAVKAAGLEPGFRWHDLRHTWASWHVQAGTSLPELQALGGWNSFEMVQRYAHLAQSQLSDAAARINFKLAA